MVRFILFAFSIVILTAPSATSWASPKQSAANADPTICVEFVGNTTYPIFPLAISTKDADQAWCKARITEAEGKGIIYSQKVTVDQMHRLVADVGSYGGPVTSNRYNNVFRVTVRTQGDVQRKILTICEMLDLMQDFRRDAGETDLRNWLDEYERIFRNARHCP